MLEKLIPRPGNVKSFTPATLTWKISHIQIEHITYFPLWKCTFLFMMISDHSCNSATNLVRFRLTTASVSPSAHPGLQLSESFLFTSVRAEKRTHTSFPSPCFRAYCKSQSPHLRSLSLLQWTPGPYQARCDNWTGLAGPRPWMSRPLCYNMITT